MKLHRREFIQLSAVGVALLLRPRAGAAAAALVIEEATIDDLQQHMKSGALSARALTQFYLDRIAALDAAGPRLRSVIEVNPAALAIAGALDDERRAKGARGPLHGIPVLLKDNIDTADQANTAGSLALAGSIPAKDAFLAARLRAAGAVLLGKSNLSEWANIRGDRSISGWSARGGQCKNPYALDRSPCGSSSGSAVAVAANLCAAAIGSETDGSIVCPANNNGVVGVKPTLGLVSRAGIIPIAHSQDTAGPLCRTVRDAAIVLGAIAGADPADPASKAAAVSDYTRALDPDGLRGARLGVWRKGATGYHRGVDEVFGKALAAMAAKGAVLVDPVDLPHLDELDANEIEVLLYELKNDLNVYLAGLPKAKVKTLADVIAFNEAHRDLELAFFGQEQFVKAQAKGPLTDKAYLEALAKNKRLAGLEGIDALMDQHKLDAIVAPTGGPAWLVDPVNGDHFGGGSSSPAAIAGYPDISVPAGAVRGLPVGVSFMGRAWSEPTLLKLAYSYEQASRARRPPQLLPTLKLDGP